MAPVVVHEQIALWVLFPETVQRMLSNALNLQMLAAVDLRWREVRDAFMVMSIVVPVESKRTPVLPLAGGHVSFVDQATLVRTSRF